jgi:hypothetical protein
MPLGLIARRGRCRRPAVMLAAGLIAVQILLAGLAVAQAALMLAPSVGEVAGCWIEIPAADGAHARESAEPAAALKLLPKR